MATSLPCGIDLEVCLALADAELGGVWDSSNWNAAVWQQADTSMGDWLDVTCDCATIDLAGGATTSDGVLSRWENRTGTLTLYGPDYDPWSAPYAGKLTPALPVRIRYRATGASGLVGVLYGLGRRGRLVLGPAGE